MNNRIKMIVVALCTITLVIPIFGATKVSASEYVAETNGQLTRDIEYDYIYLGQYPRTEIVFRSEDCITSGTSWAEDTDYIVDLPLYNKLMKAQWNKLNDTTIDGVRYHKLLRNEEKDCWGNYPWEDETIAERYYMYEPVKWRILYVDDNGVALLLSDTILDTAIFDKNKVKYVNTNTELPVIWSKSTLRTWMNGTMYNSMFSTEEKALLKPVTNTNGTGESSTTDKVFPLALNEVTGTIGVRNGFSGNSTKRGDDEGIDILIGDKDPARAADGKAGCYVKGKVQGFVAGDCTNHCFWWLRTCDKSIASTSYYPALVGSDGQIRKYGDSNSYYYGSKACVRPAIKVDISALNPTGESTGILKTESFNRVTFDKDVYPYRDAPVEPKTKVEFLTEGVDYTVSYRNNEAVGTGTAVIEGTGLYNGTLEADFEIADNIPIQDKKIIFDKSYYIYKGNPCCPKIQIEGLVQGEDYAVSFEGNNDIGVATAIATGINGYTGQTQSFFRIYRDLADSTASVSKAKYVYSGSVIKPALSLTVDDIATLRTSGVDGSSVTTLGSKTLKLAAGKDYTISYTNNKGVGKATIKATGTGNYKGTESKTFTIVPKKDGIARLTSGKKKLTVKTSSKVSATGGAIYQIAYKKKGTSKWKYTTTKTTSKTIKKLKAKKYYYVKVRAYKSVGGKKYYGAWSKTKKVKVKK